jgi:MraZ protein
MFRGCYEHTIDDKGRLSIPAKFREALETAFVPPLFLTRNENCLVAYPSDEWRLLETRVGGMSAFDPKIQAFRRFFVSPAQECHLDKAGRLLVPPTLRTFANLEREVVLAGMGNYLEIWSKERYDATMQSALENFATLAQAMGEMGL